MGTLQRNGRKLLSAGKRKPDCFPFRLFLKQNALSVQSAFPRHRQQLYGGELYLYVANFANDFTRNILQIMPMMA